MDPLARLEAWLSAEGVETGSRFVSHIEFDSNWRGAFRVVLREWFGGDGKEYIGEGPCKLGGFAEALTAALDAAEKPKTWPRVMTTTPLAPRGSALLAVRRLPGETDAEWRGRCALLTNVGDAAEKPEGKR